MQQQPQQNQDQNQQQQQQQQKSLNLGFTDLTEKFIEKGWQLSTNSQTNIVFKSPTSNYDYFELTVLEKEIHVTIPLKNSRYKYATKFESYFSACEYVEMHLREY